MNKIIDNEIDLLFQVAVSDTLVDYAKQQNRNSTSVRLQRHKAMFSLSRAIDRDLASLNPQGLVSGLSCASQVSEQEFLNQLADYIKSQDPTLWTKVTQTGAPPTPFEFIEFLIQKYWAPLVKKMGGAGGIYFPGGSDPFWNDTVKALFRIQSQKLCLYQVRTYDFQDQLVDKELFKGAEDTEAYVSRLIDKNPDLYSRCVIRRNSLFGDEWNIYSITGSKYCDHICRQTPAEWKVTFYDYEDYPIESHVSDLPLKKPDLIQQMIPLRAMYFVLSCRLPWEDTFVVQFYGHGNIHCYTYCAAEAINEKIIKYNLLHFEEVYQNLLRKDREESERLIQQQQNNSQE